MAQYNAEQLLTQRDKVSKAVSFRAGGCAGRTRPLLTVQRMHR